MNDNIKPKPDNSQGSKILCFCNRVSFQTVKDSIQAGARTLPQIYDACSAGNGPCGGSCREDIKNLLLSHQGKASPENIFMPPPALVKAISLFNRRYFWECHEVLEEEWMDEQGPNRLFYQGLIQAAAAMYHVLNANPQGCLRLAREARTKLSGYAPRYLEVPLDKLLQRLEEFEISSKEILGGSKSGFDYDRIPQLVLGSSMDQKQ